jgi:hypothetical protein
MHSTIMGPCSRFLHGLCIVRRWLRNLVLSLDEKRQQKFKSICVSLLDHRGQLRNVEVPVVDRGSSQSAIIFRVCNVP